MLEHDESTLKAGKGKQCASRLSHHRFCINVYDAITRCQTGHIALQSGPYQRAVWPFWPCHTAGFQSPCAPVGYVPGILLYARLDDFRRILLQNAVAPLLAACTKKPHAPALKLAYAALHVGVKTHAFGSPSGPACALQASVRLFRYVGLLKSVAVFLVYNLEHKP